jgi:hypothetical protein
MIQDMYESATDYGALGQRIRADTKRVVMVRLLTADVCLLDILVATL